MPETASSASTAARAVVDRRVDANVDKPEESTRESLLRVATELFATHGYHAVGMRSIADAVGVQPASVYHHFESKAAMLSEIAYAATSGFIADAMTTLAGPGRARDRLATVLHRHIHYFHTHRLEEAVTRRDMTALAPEVLADIQQTRRAYHQAVTTTIAEGCDSSDFAVESPELAAFAALDAINGINHWYRADGPVDLDTLADRYVAMVLDGLLQAGRAMPPPPTGTTEP